jgi:hypothetical protein
MRKIIILLLSIQSIICFGQEEGLGLKFTPEDQLQGIPLASTPYSGTELPTSFDLSYKLPPAGDQGQQNSCVAWAVAYAYKSYQEKIEENSNYIMGGQLNLNAVFSPAYIYNQINNGVDGGSYFSDALNILSQQGAVKWVDMPYNELDFLTQPNSSLKNMAKNYRIDFWRRVNIYDQKEVKAQINAGFPVIIGAMVDKDFQDKGRISAGQDYVWSNTGNNPKGGHAMLVVGFDDSKGAFKVLNSWGKDWGRDGYCWITYNLFPQVVREGYVMKDAINNVDNVTRPNPVVNPTSDLQANIIVSNVQHNFVDNQLGQVMRFNGTFNLPQNIGENVQIVIKFYYNDGHGGKGQPVGSSSTYFMMPDGTAACGTPKVNTITGINQWFTSMPYQYLNVPRGGFVWGLYQYRTTYLIAEPVLYIDDFAVQIGQLIPFYVNL